VAANNCQRTASEDREGRLSHVDPYAATIIKQSLALGAVIGLAAA